MTKCAYDWPVLMLYQFPVNWFNTHDIALGGLRILRSWLHWWREAFLNLFDKTNKKLLLSIYLSRETGDVSNLQRQHI